MCPLLTRVQVMHLLLKDYLEYWYESTSDDDEFVRQCHQLLQHVFIELSVRYVHPLMSHAWLFHAWPFYSLHSADVICVCAAARQLTLLSF